jgi:hypothetical protein
MDRSWGEQVANFVELRYGEVRRIYLPRGWMSMNPPARTLPEGNNPLPQSLCLRYYRGHGQSKGQAHGKGQT